MGLLPREYEEISKVMDHFGLQFTLVKRKGWIHVEVAGKTFAFHRKKETRLIDGKFLDRVRYSIRLKGTAQQSVNNFHVVIYKLREWLANEYN